MAANGTIKQDKTGGFMAQKTKLQMKLLLAGAMVEPILQAKTPETRAKRMEKGLQALR